MKKVSLLLALFVLSIFSLSAQEMEIQKPENWFNLDAVQDQTKGVSTEKAYVELLKDKKSKKTIIVAVIDSGIDILHEDLKDIIWVNSDEIAGNGKDDDNNGYVDDVNGWNFIGNTNGEMIDHDNLEMTRIYSAGLAKFKDKTEADISKKEKKEFAQFKEVEARITKEKAEAEQIIGNIQNLQKMLIEAKVSLKEYFKKEDYTLEEVQAIETEEAALNQAKGVYGFVAAQGLDDEALNEAIEHFDSQLKYNLNVDYDPRSLVGDNYSDLSEKYYGNNNVKGPDSFHGTHVSGIIGAVRDNDLGIKGIANNVKIMVVRTVPNGDERDKDVANSIIYAADNGANIINMSFGKSYSPEKAAVDKAVKYAQKKGVLFVHAAGNDSEDNDKVTNYPDRKYLKKKQAKNWIEVGASSWNESFVANFSNYGKTTVDLFAPGVDIYSTAPESNYKDASGTSMAAPVVTGVAALVWSYYPDFTAADIKKILLESAVSYKDQEVSIPGGKESVKFGELSRTGGIVNVYKALELAEKMSK